LDDDDDGVGGDGCSGLANKKTVAVEAGEGLSVVLATTKTKKANKPSSLVHRSHLKKDFRKMAKTVVNQVQILHPAFLSVSILYFSGHLIETFRKISHGRDLAATVVILEET
jgi:hypothetical protein